MKRLLVVLLLLVSFSSAQRTVKSKQGNIDITKSAGGDNIVCTANFSDELTLLKQDGDYALVRLQRDNCQGWVFYRDVEFVAKAAGDKSMSLDGVDVVGWLDNPAAVFVLENDAADMAGVDINRDFREYLQHTLDREKIEARNQEN
ncbi:MAG: hypothetical protein GX801_06715 [Fibrobacter sp.]|nr:hypothetical protein [Fibrobacter sp.]